jgi:IS1 family transposase
MSFGVLLEAKKIKSGQWLAIDRETRQVIAFHVGGRTSLDAQELWSHIPPVYKEYGKFYTDYCASYEAAIPINQHRAHGKDAGFTNHIERLNLTIRSRCSRLVRKSISFSKSLINHIGSIRYFLQTYNREVLAARF